MDKTNDTTGTWTKEVAGLSKATADLLKAAGQARDARITLDLLKDAKAKAAADDPDYIMANQEELDKVAADLETIERRLVALATSTIEAHRDTDDDLV